MKAGATAPAFFMPFCYPLRWFYGGMLCLGGEVMNPYYNPAFPAYQPPQRLAGLKGRMVSGLEEARAAQIDFDGSVSYFPCPSEGKIYTKSIDLNGMPVFMTYAVQEAPQPLYADGTALGEIKARLSAVERVLKDLGYDEPNAIAGNAPAK